MCNWDRQLNANSEVAFSKSLTDLICYFFKNIYTDKCQGGAGAGRGQVAGILAGR